MQKIPPTPLAVSPRDAARLMGVSRSRIYELINAGELPAYKDGSRTLILVADIQAWLARLKSIPPSTGPLLPAENRKTARRRATEPLLPPEDQARAIERASEPEPPPPVGQQQPAGEPEPPTPEPAEPPAPSIAPPVRSAADQARIDRWIRDRLVNWRDSCWRCRRPFALGQKFVDVCGNEAVARFHEPCHAEWLAEQGVAARRALGLDRNRCAQQDPDAVCASVPQ
jgi:excisionase family DNA binding protein